MRLRISVSSPSPPSLLPLSSSNSYSKALFLGFTKSPLRSPASQSCLGRTISVVCSISKAYNYGTVDYERRPSLRWSALYRRISQQQQQNSGMETADILDRWDAEERRITKWDIIRIVKELRKFRRFSLALEIGLFALQSDNPDLVLKAKNKEFSREINVYDWAANQGIRFNFLSCDAAVKLDLISKVHGISNAEDYFSGLSDELKDKRTHGALLNAYVRAKMKEKAETLMVEMQDCGYADEPLPYNVMMTLYTNMKEYEKAISIFDEMQERGMRMDIFSFNIWITACGAMGDIEKLEEVIQQMTSCRSINANWTTYSTLASIYIKRGDLEKAQKYMRQVELRITGRDRGPFHYLLSLYSSIGRKDEVYRIWNFYKSSFSRIFNLGYHTVLSSLAKLGDIERAEAIYEEWLSVKSSYDPKVFNVLIGWYVKEGMLEKAKILLDRVLETGGSPNPNTWDIMAVGYVRRKEVSKALSCFKEAKAASIETQVPWRPRQPSVKEFLVLCEELGDTASKKMLLELLRQAGRPDIEADKSPSNTTVRPSVDVDDSGLGPAAR
ncbi:hypothetical protein ACLOJK_030480 [Asimina triloba]